MKNIIITGAAGNLGQAVTSEFDEKDYHLNLAVRDSIENSERRTGWYPDLVNETEVSQMVRDIEKSQGEINGAVLLLGAYKPGDLDETKSEDVDSMMNINFKSAFYLVHALLPIYQKNGGGKFIFIGAKGAMNAATAGYNVAYALSKQLLVPLTQMINEANKDKNITAHILLPGTLDTPLNRKLMPDADFSKWNDTASLAVKIREIVDGKELRDVLEL
jgi:NAD(P)-dependent dehydrogenase (short-subunit alcohol dehydrogenase family)